MVYIDKDGRVLEKRPWNLNRILGIFTALWFILVQFFSTLTSPFRKEKRGGESNRRGSGWGGSSGGGGGGGGGGSGGGGFGPNRRIGRITNSMDVNVPGGGCSGGSCGR